MSPVEDGATAAALNAGTVTRISQLGPELDNQAERVVCGEVTITWPYNSVKASLAFMLAENDVRLRRDRGQVRIQLSGSSAKAVADTGVGAGDEVVLVLRGVEWARDDAPARPPGSRVEWQLNYSEELLLQVTLADSQETKIVHVDHPPVEVSRKPGDLSPVRIEPSEPLQEQSTSSTQLPNTSLADSEEYSSPAFIKRARVSYGALYEGFDIFEEDGGVKGKGRKRTRFGRDSSAWRYSSQSPGPESEEEEESPPEDGAPADSTSSNTPSRPQMMDEGCQTIDLDFNPRASVSHRTDFMPTSVEAQPLPGAPPPFSNPATQANGIATQTEAQVPSPVVNSSTLFGNIPPSTDGYSIPRFQPSAGAASFAMPGLSIGDQVRFGFHSPSQPAVYDSAADTSPVQHEQARDEAYPRELLEDRSTQPETTETQLGIASQPRTYEPEISHHPQQTASIPQNGHVPQGNHVTLWPIDAEKLDDAHAERQIAIDASLLADDEEAAEENQPDGLGPSIEAPEAAEGVIEEHAQIPETDAEESAVVYGETPARGTPSDAPEGSEESEEQEVEEEAEYEEDDEMGDDYDLRDYTDYSDDEEGLQDEDEEERRKYGPQYDEPEVIHEDGEEYDEKGEEEEEEEEEEEYDEEEEDIERRAYDVHQIFRAPPPQAQTSGPVVIDLISDSEDENEDQVANTQPSAAFAPVQSHHEPEGPQIAEAQNESEEEEEQHRPTGTIATQSPVFGTNQADAMQPAQATQGQRDQPQELSSSELRSGESDEDASGEDEDSEAGSEMMEDYEEEEHEAAGPADTVPDVATPSSSEGGNEPETSADESEKADIQENANESSSQGIETTAVEQAGNMPDAVMTADETGTFEVQFRQATPETGHEMMVIDTENPSSQNQEPEPAPVEPIGQPASTDTMRYHNDDMRKQSERMDSGNLMGFDGAMDLVPVAPSSPPLTQPFESQIIIQEAVVFETFSTQLSQVAEDSAEQLPTPRENQAGEPFLSQRAESDHLGVSSASTREQAISLSFETASDGEVAKASAEDRGTTDEVPHSSQQAPSHTEQIAQSVSPAMGTARDITQSTHEDAAVEQQLQEEGEMRPDSTETRLHEEPVPPPRELLWETDAASVRSADFSSDASSITRARRGPKRASRISQDKASIQREVIENTTEGKAGSADEGQMVTRSAKRRPNPLPLDASIQLARASLSAKPGKRASDQGTESSGASPRESRTRTRSINPMASPDFGDTSVQLAKAALRSRPATRDGERRMAHPREEELEKLLAANLPDFTSLKMLRSHINKNIDALAVATSKPSQPQRVKSRQYMMTFNITDPSIGPGNVVEVQFFRAHKESLPIVEPGNGVLLRAFTVLPLPNKGFGLRTHEDSSWAVFDRDDGLAQIRGPPVEISDAEVDHVAKLKEWYASLAEADRAVLDKASQEFEAM